MPTIRLIISLLCGLLMAACTADGPAADGTMRYARWLTMTDSTAAVLNPWRPGEVLHKYTLEPCRRAVSATSLHAYLAHRLGAMDRIVGVMDADYIVAPELRAALNTTKAPPHTTAHPSNTTKATNTTEPTPSFPTVNGGATLADMGSSQSPNLERIKAAGADLIFASPFENAGYGSLETLGVPIVECADYMETSPLGRAEWMRFYGRILGHAAEADSLFAAEEAAYKSLCTHSSDKAPASEATVSEASAEGRPSVLLGKRTGQAWYVPGGESFLGSLLADAGAAYVFADEATAGSVPLDFEAVYARAKDADIWIITYAAPPSADGTFAPMTYAHLAAEDERYTHFRAFRERRVWACNTLEVPYYDALPWTPSTFLREVIAIVRPERLADVSPQYFRPLQ